jgi:hypothetical protein
MINGQTIVATSSAKRKDDEVLEVTSQPEVKPVEMMTKEEKKKFVDLRTSIDDGVLSDED